MSSDRMRLFEDKDLYNHVLAECYILKIIKVFQPCTYIKIAKLLYALLSDDIAKEALEDLIAHLVALQIRKCIERSGEAYKITTFGIMTLTEQCYDLLPRDNKELMKLTNPWSYDASEGYSYTIKD